MVKLWYITSSLLKTKHLGLIFIQISVSPQTSVTLVLPHDRLQHFPTVPCSLVPLAMCFQWCLFPSPLAVKILPIQKLKWFFLYQTYLHLAQIKYDYILSFPRIFSLFCFNFLWKLWCIYDFMYNWIICFL